VLFLCCGSWVGMPTRRGLRLLGWLDLDGRQASGSPGREERDVGTDAKEGAALQLGCVDEILLAVALIRDLAERTGLRDAGDRALVAPGGRRLVGTHGRAGRLGALEAGATSGPSAGRARASGEELKRADDEGVAELGRSGTVEQVVVNPDFAERLVVSDFGECEERADLGDLRFEQVHALARDVVEVAGAARCAASTGVIDEATLEGEAVRHCLVLHTVFVFLFCLLCGGRIPNPTFTV